MAHEHDYWEGWRSWFIPKLGGIARFLEDVTGDKYYVESETHNNQFVGRVDMNIERFEESLHEMGFVRNPLASLKQLPSGKTEEGSFRKIGYDEFPEMQLHVITYDGSKMQNADSSSVYVYAHWELRWDVHPWKHYRGDRFNAQEGVRRMKDLLDQNGINYTLERPPAGN